MPPDLLDTYSLASFYISAYKINARLGIQLIYHDQPGIPGGVDFASPRAGRHLHKLADEILVAVTYLCCYFFDTPQYPAPLERTGE